MSRVVKSCTDLSEITEDRSARRAGSVRTVVFVLLASAADLAMFGPTVVRPDSRVEPGVGVTLAVRGATRIPDLARKRNRLTINHVAGQKISGEAAGDVGRGRSFESPEGTLFTSA